MANRSSGPEVYSYAPGTPGSGSFENPPPYLVQQSTISRQPSANLSSADPRLSSQPSQWPQQPGSRVSGVGSSNRFEQYRARSPEYKYNLFSIADQPWNRCCELGSCGSCPGNECVAKRQPRLDWV